MVSTEPRWYAFRNTVRAKRYAEAEASLKRDPELIKLRSALGETVLHFLAVENNREAVAWLHARGADLNTKNKCGTPVSFEIALLRRRELFAWFVQHGVDLKATDADGQD